MKKLKEKGITLVALVIMIIILLILAGVTLNTVLGDNGLFERAKLAVEKYKEAEVDEMGRIDEITNEVDKIIEGMNREIPTVKEAIKAGKDFAKEGNKEIVDEFNNHLIIPQGFHIVTPDDNNGVIYDYTEKGDNIPTVQDGIVIEDEEGNQFVWIPVGTINNKKESEEKTTEIKLARRTFDDKGNVLIETEEGETALETYYIEETIEEHAQSKYGNNIAKDIEQFKKSANSNHGYYIGRYEAGKGIDGKPTSKKGAVWNTLVESVASQAAKKMYENNDNYTSDLINSYIWDTTIFSYKNIQEIMIILGKEEIILVMD